MDLSTLKLARLPIAKIPPTCHVSLSMGSGCFLDPPGYPSYFLRHIWDRRGNSPSQGANDVIRDADGVNRVVFTADDWGTDKRAAKLLALWSPLPIDHPRTEAWIRYVYGYVANMYQDDTVPEARRANMSDMMVKSTANADRCTPDKSAAVRYIQRYYPDHQPDLALLDNRDGYGSKGGGSWWETEAERPDHSNCKPRNGMHHPINGNWCQWCGWVKEG